MNRIIKIIIYAIVLFLLYLWITSVAKSCNNPSTTTAEVQEEVGEDYVSSDEEIYDEYFEEEDAIESEKETAVNEEINVDVEESDYEEDFSFESEEEEDEIVTTAPVRNSGSTGGRYLVVAGSYLIKDNAEKMVSRLKKLGYSNAEVVNFDLSQYHTISAGKYNSYDEAADATAAIKAKGIDCYVHTRK